MTKKETKILELLNQSIEESIHLDVKERLEKIKKGDLDIGGDSSLTNKLKLIKELFLY
jgi:hypothetical protein